MTGKKVLITGIAGQDGSYLSEFLLEKGYEVHGLVRSMDSESIKEYPFRLNNIKEHIYLHYGSVNDLSSLVSLFEVINPDECYHLAAESFVSYSFDGESSVIARNIDGTLNVLLALSKSAPQCRLYYAGSSEMFGLAEESPQNEKSRFHPRAPYGIFKLAGHYLVQNFREVKNVFACTGILYNHESPRRGQEFVTRKITRAVAEIKFGLRQNLSLGNIEAKRDWGFAGDYVKAMWLMLQQGAPNDYVIATGQLHTVKDFVSIAFNHVGLDWEKYVVIDEQFFRPSEKFALAGNSLKAKKDLLWSPSMSFENLVKLMVDEDLKLINKGI